MPTAFHPPLRDTLPRGECRVFSCAGGGTVGVHLGCADGGRHGAEGCAAPKLRKEGREAEARIAAVEMREMAHARRNRGSRFEKS